MKYLPRSLENIIRKASQQFSLVWCTGARQTGKTTNLRHLTEPQRQNLPSDDLNLRALAQEAPPLFLQRFSLFILIGEIQHAFCFLPYIKILIDEKCEKGMLGLSGFQ